jgi:hypothetical protein
MFARVEEFFFYKSVQMNAAGSRLDSMQAALHFWQKYMHDPPPAAVLNT